MNNLSIVIPTCGQRFLERTLEGLVIQEDNNFEVVVVENGVSSEATQKLCNQFKKRLKLKYIFEENPGANRARNIGVKNSGYEIIGLIDDDCIPNPDFAKKVRKKHQVYSEAGVIGGKVNLRFLNEKPIWLEGIFRSYLAELNWGQTDFEIEDYQYLVGANFTFKREDFDRVNGFNEGIGLKGSNLLSNDELDFTNNIRKKGRKIIYSPEVLITHQIPQERTSLDYLLRKSYFQGKADVILTRKNHPYFDEEDAISFLNTQLVEDELEIIHLEEFRKNLGEPTFSEYLTRFILSKEKYYRGVIDEIESNPRHYSEKIQEYSRMSEQHKQKMEKLKRFGRGLQ